MTTKFQQTMTSSPSGAEICIYHRAAQSAPKAVVHINHGMAEHAARYQRFADDLSAAGYHVVAHDHRGHGKTTAPNAPLGSFSNKNGLQKVLEDIYHVNQFAKNEYPDTPVVLFGHSMGTILAFNYFMTQPKSVDAVALWNSGFDTGIQLFIYQFALSIERMFKGSDSNSAIAHRLTFEDWNKKFAPNRTKSDWLSRDTMEVDKYEFDPLCGFPVTIGLWFDMIEAIKFGASDDNLAALPKSMPIHLIGGGDDPCTNKGKAVQNLESRLNKAQFKDVTCNILAGTRHESLNEINRDQTTADFIKWLDQKFL